MRAILASSVLVLGIPISAMASERTMYVAGDSLNVRLCAGADCCVADRLKQSEQVQVMEEQDGWARISVFHDPPETGQDCRRPEDELAAYWVSLDYLTTTVPDDFDANAWNGMLSDRRIRGVPKVGDYGLERGDVETIRRYAAQLLANGICEAIEAGNKSVSRVGTFYVLCEGESEQRYFTTSDIGS